MSILEARGTKRNIGAIGTDQGNGGGIGTPPDADAIQQQGGARQCINAGDQFGANAHIGMMRSSMRMSIICHDNIARRVSRARIAAEEANEMFIELDSHADTVCVGANCHVIEYKQEMVNVEPYHMSA
jgi:hypothetical protein